MPAKNAKRKKERKKHSTDIALSTHYCEILGSNNKARGHRAENQKHAYSRCRRPLLHPGNRQGLCGDKAAPPSTDGSRNVEATLRGEQDDVVQGHEQGLVARGPRVVNLLEACLKGEIRVRYSRFVCTSISQPSILLIISLWREAGRARGGTNMQINCCIRGVAPSTKYIYFQ